MAEFRVTKYPPSNRDDSGRYLVDEWTSASEIGNSCGGRILTVQKYLSVEGAYVEAVRRFIAKARVVELQVVGLERHEVASPSPGAFRFTDEVEQDVSDLSEGVWIRGVKLDAAIRAVLRELMWCRLETHSGVFVHFGYDYYMYIGLPRGLPPPPAPPGMYVEECESPIGDGPSAEAIHGGQIGLIS